MTKQGYIEWRKGRAAFKAGLPLNLAASHEWKMGWLSAKHGQEG
jgi:hypothetical protein